MKTTSKPSCCWSDMLPDSVKRALRYVRRVLKSLDSFVNVLTFGALWETISGRLGRLQREGSTTACWLCAVLNLFEKNHCELARLEDEKRMNL
jgi:hypothetical protein